MNHCLKCLLSPLSDKLKCYLFPRNHKILRLKIAVNRINLRLLEFKCIRQLSYHWFSGLDSKNWERNSNKRTLHPHLPLIYVLPFIKNSWDIFLWFTMLKVFCIFPLLIAASLSGVIDNDLSLKMARGGRIAGLIKVKTPKRLNKSIFVFFQVELKLHEISFLIKSPFSYTPEMVNRFAVGRSYRQPGCYQLLIVFLVLSLLTSLPGFTTFCRMILSMNLKFSLLMLSTIHSTIVSRIWTMFQWSEHHDDQ